MVPKLDSSARLAAALRALLHSERRLAAEAASQLVSSLVPPLVHAPSAPLHGLPPLPPAILAADAAAADLDAGFGYAAASGGGGRACDVRRAAFTVAEARKLESLAHDGGLEPQLRAAAATQLAAVLAADGRLLRASLQASSLEAAVTSVAAIATMPAASVEAEEDDQTGPLLASL